MPSLSTHNRVATKAVLQRRLWLQPDELASGRETSSSQNDEDDEDNVSMVGSSRSITNMYQLHFSERDGDYFYDAMDTLHPTSRKHHTPSSADSPHTASTPEHVSSVPPESPVSTNGSLATAARPVLASPSPQQVVSPAIHSPMEPSPRADLSAAAGASLSPAWLASEPTVQRRLELPEPKETQKSVGLWSIIKEAIGKDLTRICLPVYFNEPLSALQKMVEEVEYSYLLDKSASCPKGSMHRLAWLAIFAISGCVPCNRFHAIVLRTVRKNIAEARCCVKVLRLGRENMQTFQPSAGGDLRDGGQGAQVPVPGREGRAPPHSSSCTL
jgi:hypothetical protein